MTGHGAGATCEVDVPTDGVVDLRHASGRSRAVGERRVEPRKFGEAHHAAYMYPYDSRSHGRATIGAASPLGGVVCAGRLALGNEEYSARVPV